MSWCEPVFGTFSQNKQYTGSSVRAHSTLAGLTTLIYRAHRYILYIAIGKTPGRLKKSLEWQWGSVKTYLAWVLILKALAI